jgi:hypothetical protein
MAFTDPVAAYTSASNLEAHLVSNLLTAADIESMVIEDVSQAGVWAGGVVSQFHKPQVWIERADLERARPVLDEFERKMIERQNSVTNGELIQVVCEECGTQSSFPVSQSGTVQDCPHCHNYVDVGDEESSGEWDTVTDDEDLPQ